MKPAPKPAVYLDLDGTLFRSRRRITENNLILASLTGNGHPQGFRTRSEQELYIWLFANAEIIPVTGRDERALASVFLPCCRRKVLSFGTVVYDNGPDYAWRNHVNAVLRQKRTALLMMRYVPDLQELKVDICEQDGNPAVIVARTHDRSPLRDETAHSLLNFAHELGLNVSMFGGDRAIMPYGMFFMPFGIGKKDAVRYLRQKEPDRPSIGIGDQHSDYAFMDECDVVAFPRHSELAFQLLKL